MRVMIHVQSIVRMVRNMLGRAAGNGKQFSVSPWFFDLLLFRSIPKSSFYWQRTAGNLNPGGQRRKTMVIVSKRLQPNYVNTGPELGGVTML